MRNSNYCLHKAEPVLTSEPGLSRPFYRCPSCDDIVAWVGDFGRGTSIKAQVAKYRAQALTSFRARRTRRKNQKHPTQKQVDRAVRRHTRMIGVLEKNIAWRKAEIVRLEAMVRL